MHSNQKLAGSRETCLTRPDTPRAFVSGRYSYVNDQIESQEESAPKPTSRVERPTQETRR
jgi:hypothetical protein